MAAAPGWAPGCVNLWFLCVWFFFFACARRRLPFLNFWGGGKAAVSFGLSGGCAALGWRRRWPGGDAGRRRVFVSSCASQSRCFAVKIPACHAGDPGSPPVVAFHTSSFLFAVGGVCGRFARVWGGGGAGGPRGLVLGWGVGVVWGRARVCRAQAGRLASVGGLFLACACLCGRALRRILLERALAGCAPARHHGKR